MAAIITKMIGPDSPPQAVAGVIALALAAGLVMSLVVGLITGAIVALWGCTRSWLHSAP
jgi:dolichol kinase